MGKVTTEFSTQPAKPKYVDPFHAYECVLTPKDENGWTQLFVQTTDAKGRDWDKVSVNQSAVFHDDKLKEWETAIVASNAHVQACVKRTDIDSDRWGNLKCGVVYKPSTKKNPATDQYEENGYCEPWFLIPIGEVATFIPQEAKYDAWCKKFGKGKYYSSDGGSASEPVSVALVASSTPAPIDDDLPF
jgi:hypothetical protein